MNCPAIDASERLLIYGWCLFAVATLCATVVFCVGARFRKHRLLGPLVPSLLAALPSFVSVMELAIRAVAGNICGCPVAMDAIASPVLKPWILVGALLLIVGFSAVPFRSVPLAANLVRLGHVVLWSIGSLLALQAIAGV